MKRRERAWREGYVLGWVEAIHANRRLCRDGMHWSTAFYVLRSYWWNKLRAWISDKDALFPPRIEG